MKAAVCYEHRAPLVVEDVDLDPPQDGEVKVRIAATAICHSDVHNMNGEHDPALPAVYGHEAAGTIDEVGDNVTGLHVGDPVVVVHLRACGCCVSCVTGFPHTCEGTFALNEGTRLHNRSGEPLVQGIRTGYFAEYVVVHQSQCVPIGDDIPMDRACLLACAVITGFCAVTNAAKVRPGASVVVVGTGGVGVNAIQGAVASGAYPIIAVDVLDHKLQAARAFGATHTVNSATSTDTAQAIRDLTNGRGADYVFVTVGSTDAAAQAFGFAAQRGMEVLVGVPALTAKMTLPMSEWVVSERVVVGSLMGSARTSIDIPRIAQMYRERRYKLDELITKRYTLDEINEAVGSMVRGDALRNVIVF